MSAMSMNLRLLARSRLPHTLRFVGPVIVWAVWAAMTVATVLFIRQYSRNVPYADDFDLVSMYSGHQEVNLRWVWGQHNEHRPVIARLVLAAAFALRRQ